MADAALEIRSGRTEDAAVLAKFAAKTAYETHAPLSYPEETKAYTQAAFTPEKLALELKDSGNIFFLAWSGQELVGYAKLSADYPLPQAVGPKPIALQRLYLDPEWFGRGLGPQLMDLCVKAAAQKGFETLWLQVHVKNERAIAFYKKRGFSIAGVCDFCLGQVSNPNYLMTRPVKQACEPSSGL